MAARLLLGGLIAAGVTWWLTRDASADEDDSFVGHVGAALAMVEGAGVSDARAFRAHLEMAHDRCGNTSPSVLPDQEQGFYQAAIAAPFEHGVQRLLELSIQLWRRGYRHEACTLVSVAHGMVLWPTVIERGS